MQVALWVEKNPGPVPRCMPLNTPNSRYKTAAIGDCIPNQIEQLFPLRKSVDLTDILSFASICLIPDISASAKAVIARAGAHRPTKSEKYLTQD